MPIDLMVQKVGGDTLRCATPADIEQIAHKKTGQAFYVSLTQSSPRVLNNHRLYWGGLIGLLSDYWDDGSVVSVYDRKVMSGLIKWLQEQGHNTSSFELIISEYLSHRSKEIAKHIPEYNKAARRANSIHKWLKEQVGYYELEMTPTGLMKNLKSINFNAMGEDEFRQYYKDCFSVAWKYVFSKANFKDQIEAENTAMEMVRMAR